jgi:hypothetical protein
MTWEGAATGAAGVVFDGAGEQLPPRPDLLARRLGCGGATGDVVARTVRECGFVYVGPVHDALLVKLEPATVRPLAAFAAFYEIAGRSPRRLILSFPGDCGGPDRYEIFANPIDGLKRIELALAGSAALPKATAPTSLPVAERGSRPPRRRALRRGADLGLSRPRAAAARTRPRAGDSSERLARPLDAIGPDDGWLRELLAAWRHACAGRRLPSIESLDSFELLNIARGRAHIVDTRDAHPGGYRFRLWGTVNSYGSGHANKTLGEMPAGPMRDAAIEDYRDIVATGRPSYQLIYHVEDRRPYSYARLVLPLAADGRRIDRLIVLINERPLAELDAP